MKTESKAFLAALTIMGAFLRLYNLSFQCMWTEEQYTLAISKLSFLQIFIQSFAHDFNPPLYYFAAHLSMMLSGFTDVSIRYPSVVCGIFMIPAMYYLGETYKDELTGLYCAGFTTIVFPLIYYAQYARAYEMSVFFFVITLILYIKMRRGVDRWSQFAFIVTAWMNIWIHLFSIIPIGMMLADYIFTRFGERWPTLISTGFILAPLLSMFTSIVSSRAISSGVSYGASAIEMIVLTPVEFFNTLFLNIIVLAGVGIYFDKSPVGKRLVVITILTLIIGVVCSMFTPFFPRYYMTVSMIFLLFAAVACVNLTELVPNKFREPGWRITIFVVVIMLFFLLELSNFSSHYDIQQYVCGVM